MQKCLKWDFAKTHHCGYPGDHGLRSAGSGSLQAGDGINPPTPHQSYCPHQLCFSKRGLSWTASMGPFQPNVFGDSTTVLSKMDSSSLK